MQPRYQMGELMYLEREVVRKRTLPRTAVGSVPVEDSELRIDSLQRARKTRKASLASTMDISGSCSPQRKVLQLDLKEESFLVR